MTIRLISIRDIKPNPDNPRIIKDDKFRKLVQSIKDFPEMLQLRPIVVNSDMVVLGGNMRLKACIEAGLTEVPTILASGLTDERQREFIIKDNVGFGEWDWDALANEWSELPLRDWAVDIPDVGEFDKVSMVNRGDESSEWLGMPQFESADKPFKIVISFDAVDTRTEFAKHVGLPIQSTTSATWSSSWPVVPRDDTKNIRYE